MPAEAFFHFSNDIQATAAEIRQGMQQIERELASSRGGNVNLFGNVVTAATRASATAREELAKVGLGLQKSIGNQSSAGGGKTLNAQYKALRDAAVANVADETRRLTKGSGLNKGETERIISAGQREVRQQIKALFDEIASKLAAQRGLQVSSYLRGGLGTSTRNPKVDEFIGRNLPGMSTLVEKSYLGSPDKVAIARAKAIEDEAYRIDRDRNKTVAETTAVEKSIRRQKDKQLAQEATALRQAERDGANDTQRATLDRVSQDSTARWNKARTQVVTGSGDVFNARGAGLEQEKVQKKITQALQNNVQSIQNEIDQRRSALQHESLSQSFLGGLTSSGFGSKASGFDSSGIARSFGSTVKFTTQYEALQLVQNAFSDTIREAVKYRDNLTDLNVALGQGNDASARYVDSLSNISKLAGGNVGDALESAARGVRAFGQGLDAEQKKEAGLETARAATTLSVIGNKTIPDATGDIVAIGSAFNITADHLQHITDVISAAKQQGGDPAQISQGLASGGVALQAAGFSAAEGAQVLSRVVLQLDQSGQATATRITRIIQALSGTAGRTLVRSLGIDPNSSQRDQLVTIATNLAAGQYNDAQQAQIRHTLGGTSNLRELQVLLHSIGHELSGGFANGFDVAGRGQKEMDRRTHNLAGELRILRGTITNIQNELFDSGAFAPFLAALAAIQPVVGTVEELLKLFNQLAHVGPNIHLGPITLPDAVVGVAEVVGVRKLYGRFNNRQTEQTALLSSLETDLSAAKLASAKASLLEVDAESAEGAARTAQVVKIEEQIAALRALEVAKIQSDVPAGGLFSRAKTSVKGDAASVGAFLGTGLGKASLVGLALITTVQTALKISSVVSAQNQSQAAGLRALNEIGVGKPGAAIDALSAAAAARDRSSSGIFGNAIDDFRKLTGGPDAEKDAKNLRIERDSEKAILKQRKAETAAAQATSGRYADIFGNLSVDSLKAGFDELDASGASATRTIALLNSALSDVGDAPRVGVLKAGSASRIADSIKETIIPAVTDALATPGKGNIAPPPIGSNQLQYFYQHRAQVIARKDTNQAYLKAQGLKPLSDADATTQAVLDVQRDNSAADAKTALNNSPAFKLGKRSQLLEQAQQLLKDKFNEQVGPNGGVLTAAQIHEDAVLLADFLIGKDPKLRAARDAIIAAEEKAIREKTTVGGALIGQDTANAVAADTITRSAAKRTEVVDLSYNPATGETNPLAADVGHIRDLQGVIARIRKSNLQVPDTALTELYNAYHQLVDDRVAELKKNIAIVDAKETAGIDPRNTEATAAAAVDAARRNLAVARPGIEFYQAQSDLLKAQQAYADEVTNARATAVFNGVNPSNSIASATAALEANRIELAGLKRSVKPATALNDFDTHGNPVGVAPDFVDVGKGTGASFLEGLKTQDYFGTAAAIGQQIINGLNSTGLSSTTTPPVVPIPGKHLGVIGERPDGTVIKGLVPDVTPTLPAKVTAAQAAQLPSMLAKLRQYESGSDYTSQSSISTASGAYQYLDSTWNNYGGYKHAREAPQSVQDKRAVDDLFANLKKYGGDWDKVLAAHFAGSGWVDSHPDKSTWNVNPVPGSSNPTVAQYVASVSGTRPGPSKTVSGPTGGAGQAAIDKKTQEGVALAQTQQRAIVDYANASVLASADPNNSIEQAKAKLQAATNTLRSEAGIGKAGNTAYQQALAAAKQAQLDLSKAYLDRANAASGADAARVGGNLAQAAAGLTEAKRNLAAQAPNTAEYFHAQAALYDAQRTSAQAQLDYSATLLTLSGDITNPLVQAQDALRVARRKLREDTAKKQAPDVLATDRLNVRQAETAAEATAFSQRFSDAQTADQLGRISHVAYLKYLRGEHDRLTAIKVKTYQQQQELDQVDQAIKSAANSLQGQFNLGDIKIPTPYEVRRSIAASTAGLTPADAATGAKTTNIYINGADVGLMKRVVLGAIGPTSTGRVSVATSKV